ncbi:uncharacterized protein LOC143913060 isoform X2 [Arctopsyche grandis]|uniref:uncharacterized protein LOC143913060 isoform X2 n=1 Tax=Arctopsyche grandis TaxID=121162 RepID=UPI00406D78E1
MSFKLTFGVVLVIVISLTSTLACPKNFKGDIVHDDSTKFYRCHDGSATVMPCPDGQEFHAELKVCLEPVLEKSLIHFGSQRVLSSILKDDDLPECRRNQTTTIYFPHATSCTLFYSCVNGILTLLVCPEGTEFNVDKLICDWISDSGCLAQTPNTTSTSTSTSTSTTTPDPTTPEPTTPDPTTSDPTTPEPTTPEPTTPESTTPEPTTPDETTPDETTPDETTPEPTTPEPTTPEPTTPEPTTPEPDNSRTDNSGTDNS